MPHTAPTCLTWRCPGLCAPANRHGRRADVTGAGWTGRLLRLALPALLLLAWLAPSGAAAAAGPQPLRIGIYENPPKIGLDAGGRAQGFFVEVIEAIARAEGWHLVYVPGTWTQGLERLESGEIDLMPDVAWSAARAQRYDFHQESVLSSWSQAYSRPGAGVRALPDLDGRRVAVLDGSVQQEVFDSMVQGFGLRAELLRHADYGAAFHAVAQGRADAAMVGREMRMLELKHEVDALCERLDEPTRYGTRGQPAGREGA